MALDANSYFDEAGFDDEMNAQLQAKLTEYIQSAEEVAHPSPPPPSPPRTVALTVALTLTFGLGLGSGLALVLTRP